MKILNPPSRKLSREFLFDILILHFGSALMYLAVDHLARGDASQSLMLKATAIFLLIACLFRIAFAVMEKKLAE